MTEPVETPAVTDPAATPEPKRRGRPRPQSTITRDEEVLAYLSANSDKTINAITDTYNAAHPGAEVKRSLVYLSVCRLRKLGLVVKERISGQYVWKQTAPLAA
jgi:hypothetical protein